MRSKGEQMLGRRRALGTVAGTAVLALGLVACGGSSSGGGGGGSSEPTQGEVKTTVDTADTVNTGTPGKGGSFTYTIEKPITDWNLNTALGNTFDTGVVLNAVLPQAFIPQPDTSNVELNKDFLVSADQTKTDPQTIVYKIQPDAVWSDGKPIDASDFEYAWRTQNGVDCPDCSVASTTGTDQIKSITGTDGGKTVTVVFKTPYADWKGLFGAGYGLLPAHLCKCDMTDAASLAKSFNDTFDKTYPTFSGGPYMITAFKNNEAVTLQPNPKWYGEGAFFNKLIFRQIVEDQASVEPDALRNKEVQGIYPQPELDLVDAVKAIPNVKYQLDLGLTWEHFDLNMNNPFLGQNTAGDALRKALFTAVNVKQIIASTVGQFDPAVVQLNNRMLMPAQDGYQDNVTEFGYGAGNIDAAKKLLTDAGYTGVGSSLKTPDGKAVPQLRARFTVGNAIRQDECNLLKDAAAKLGVNIKVQPTPDLGGTLTHKNDNLDYDIVVFAWVGAPFFTSNRDIYITGGGSNFGSYSNKVVDRNLKATVSTLDHTRLLEELNAADKQISADAYTLPLYQKPTFLAYYNDILNLRDNATNVGPSYNVNQWGRKAAS